MPESAMVAEAAGAETLTSRDALFTPADAGLKATEAVQVLPTARPAPLIGQVVVFRNSAAFAPVAVILVMISGAVPVLLIVTV